MAENDDVLHMEIFNGIRNRTFSARQSRSRSSHQTCLTYALESFDEYWLAMLLWDKIDPAGALKILLGLNLRESTIIIDDYMHFILVYSPIIHASKEHE